MLSKMKVEELKTFLRLRGLKVSGKKQELVARVFIAIENGIEVLPTALEMEKQLSADYAEKLQIDGTILPDPFALEDGWLDEDSGMKYYPPTTYPDICNYLQFFPAELASKDLNDYKTSKAYSYFKDGWLETLEYNEVDQYSKYCLLKTRCRPSQRMNDAPHKLWICVNKKDGKILRSYCTCMAGMSETCNHVAATLFRLEAAVRLGLTRPSSTSTVCNWLPNLKVVKPERLENMKWSRSDFGKRGKKSRELNSSPKKCYKPADITGEELQLDEIAEALRAVCSENDSIIFSAFPKSKRRSDRKEGACHPLSLNDVIEMSESAEEVFKHMRKIKVQEIEQATRGQSDNPIWHLMRKHVISGSKAHDVKTKMDAWKRKNDASIVSFVPLFDKIAGRSYLNPELPALQYGKAKEKYAIINFETEFRNTHTQVKVLDCGVFLIQDMPYVGASPDAIVMCDCCGIACLEVKCPFSIRDLSPLDSKAKLPYLVRGEKSIYLNRKHKYYTQCQMEMAASQCKKCYFYVWTPHGSFTECLEMDEVLWKDSLEPYFRNFYTEHYIPSFFV